LKRQPPWSRRSPVADHKTTLLSEFDALNEVDGIDNLLMALGPFFEHLRGNAALADRLDDVARDVQAVHARFTSLSDNGHLRVEGDSA
jgi:hypothetical protein